MVGESACRRKCFVPAGKNTMHCLEMTAILMMMQRQTTRILNMTPSCQDWDPDELMDMDEDERDEALEDAGLDPDDYDF